MREEMQNSHKDYVKHIMSLGGKWMRTAIMKPC